MDFQTAYNRFNEIGDIDCTGDIVRTQQHMKEECDINTIVNRFLKTGLMPQSVSVPRYEDFSEVMDFQGAQNALVASRENFMKIPAKIRAKFDNSPQKFLEFCEDSANAEEMVKMGLAVAKDKPIVATPDKPA